MVSTFDLEIINSTNKKEKPTQDQVPFGTVFTDHMFTMEYEEGIGWHEPKITPYAPITLDPAAMIFHYGQTVFEGMKAYRTEDDACYCSVPRRTSNALICQASD